MSGNDNRLIIRSLNQSDYKNWLPLWDGNNLGQHNKEVTSTTWHRICDPQNKQVNGLCAERGGEILGIVHYILHPTTGQINHVCYMQDVYVSPDHRRQGIAKRMISSLTQLAHHEKWARMYWLTQFDNIEAKAMYENFGVKLDFTLYVLPIS